MNRVLERSKRFCGYLVGIVFFLSGMFKLLDPVGAGLVVSEYYRFLHIGFMEFSAKAVGVSMALLETFLGLALITGLWRKVVAIITMTFLAMFTLLTLLLVIFNPTMDCGCFGEVVHLTHLQTFLKNIVLCLLAAAAFFPLSALGKPKKRKYVTFAVVGVEVILFTIYSLTYIPLKDYTDFRPGARLAASGMQMSQAADNQTYEAIFIYEKNGRQDSFTLDALPDSTWTFVRTETVRKDDNIVSDGPVRLPISDAAGVTRDEVAADGAVMLASVYEPKSVSVSRWRRIARALENAASAGFKPILLVAAVPGDFPGMLGKIEDENVKDVIFGSVYYSDYKSIVSLNRSNGGVTCFSRGFLIRKWSARNMPGLEKMESVAGSDIAETYLSYSTGGSLVFQGVLLFAFAAMLLL